MTSAVDVCNRGLQKIGEKPITSLTEDSPRARDCNRAYTVLRDAELRAHPWSFAKARVSIAKLSDAPAFGFENQYQLPADFLRLLPDNEVTDWTIEGRKILTDDDSPLKIIYIRKVEDENEFDALFVEVLACRLAVELAEKITQSTSKRQLAREEYDRALAEARRVNAFEKVSQVTPTDDYILARL